ncbi:hypothetical protein LSAT2_009798 [Lamellibrachia satsuma]|nr:hypothetical protein LSAT2_009798 [Lamellibrachia satsuma]
MTSLLLQVTMADRAAAERACKEPNPVIDGRKANVNLAYLGAKPRGIQTAATAFPLAALKAGIPGIMQNQYGECSDVTRVACCPACPAASSGIAPFACIVRVYCAAAAAVAAARWRRRRRLDGCRCLFH